MSQNLLTASEIEMNISTNGTIKPTKIVVPESVDDLPRSVKRRIRAATHRGSTPVTENSLGRPDVYPIMLDVGLIVVEHAGHAVDLDSLDYTDAESEALEAALAVLGMRVITAQAGKAKPKPKPTVDESPSGKSKSTKTE